MRIERKIILSDIIKITFIVLIGIFAFQNINLVLAKLRFVEIADDLNASFLEMRLSEKNYFLYKDERALADIKDKIDKTMDSIDLVKNDIIRATGEQNLELLRTHLMNYTAVVEEVRRSPDLSGLTEARLRTEGKKLKEFSETLTRIERTRVNDIISRSKNMLLYSFIAIFLSAIIVGHTISQRIVRSLREIEKLTKSISAGNFHKIEGMRPKDEMGSVIDAINSMSEELKLREEELIQAKKLSSLGVLTAGVAHELTNPLNNISMIAQTYTDLYDKLGRNDRIEFMNKIDAETERIKEIVKNLLDFSKPKEAHLKRADINGSVEKAISLMRNTLDITNIYLKVNLGEGVPAVLIDELQMQQVLVNLITNAVQAMPSGGTLFITTRQGKTREMTEVTVMDTGKGIPAEFLPHIFDPFFTTKGDGGTGLGLSVSYGIIKNHKGTIRAESKVGVGTTFTIELPAYKEEETNVSV
jgi:two-component system NtrC family sensor kinase